MHGPSLGNAAPGDHATLCRVQRRWEQRTSYCSAARPQRAMLAVTKRSERTGSKLMSMRRPFLNVLIFLALLGGAAVLLVQPSIDLHAQERTAREPVLVTHGLHHVHPADHAGMVGAAVFGAEQMILARPGGREPGEIGRAHV